MHLRIERRGGLVGRLAVGERELHELTARQRRALDALVKSPKRSAPSPGADRFHYKIVVTDDGGGTRTFDVGEDDMPEALASIPQLDL